MLSPLLLAAAGWGAPAFLCRLDDSRISESSGVAPSLVHKGEWLTHNDSGDRPRFFRFNEKGRVTAVYSVRGAKAVDWEDIASRRIQGHRWIYLADTGDNARKRKTITVYRVEEPAGPAGSVDAESAYEIAYEDKPRDCEALIVAPNGDLWLVTKARDLETCVYVVRKPSKKGLNTARLLTRLPVNTGGGAMGILVTGGDASQDGKSVILRTYTGALEYKVKGSFDSWLRSEPVPVKLAVEPQGEAVAYSLDGRTILTTSEGTPCPVSKLEKS